MNLAVEAIAAAALPGAAGATANAGAAMPDFSQWLEQNVSGVNQDVTRAEHAAQLLAAGQADSLPDVMIAIEQARGSLSLMLQVRDRLVSAYQDILRMQI